MKWVELKIVTFGSCCLFAADRTQIGMFRPIRMDHTNCLQVAIKSIQKKKKKKGECRG